MLFEYDLNYQNCEWVEIENHDDYLKLLKALKKKTKYIVIIQIDEKNDKDKHIIQANKSLELAENGFTTAYFSTITSLPGKMKYVFKRPENESEFFDYLEKFNTFFDRKKFGIDDIGFLNNRMKVLAYTITHEELTGVDKDFWQMINDEKYYQF
ncbi:MAG: hypothetical protein IJK60_02885 [Clostridia bacterium]|nr:hypothetical protein [Clostridia bacterium]